MAKKKSIFRYEAIIPITILILLGGIYTQFFMDFHARKGLEWALSKAVGAEVNIRTLESHISRGTLQLSGIEITDADQPNQNIAVLNKIDLSWNWDALLRGKVVINKASVTDIATHTPRKKTGKVYPKSTEPSLVATEFQKLTQTAVSGVKENSANTLFGDALSLLDNKEASIIQLSSQLQSTQLITAFGEQIQTSQETWQRTLAVVSTPNTGLDKKVADLKNLDFKSINDAQKWLQNAKSLQSDVQSQLDTITKAQSQFNSDMTALNGAFGKINTSIAKDMKTLGTYIQIPKIPESQMSEYLLNTYLGKYLKHYETAKTWADKYLPPNLLHKKEKVTITPIPQKKGILYTYGTQNTYPLFWLKHAEISSIPSSKSPKIGALKGEITNLSTDQKQIQKPFKGHLAGDFPGLHIQGMTLDIQIDRRTTTPQDLLAFQIAAYPIQTLSLLDSPELTLALTKATGRVQLSAKRQSQHLDLRFTQYFENAVFDVQAQNPLINDISVAAFSDLTHAQIEGTGSGDISQLAFEIHSDLGNALANSFSKEIDRRIQAEKEKIQKDIETQFDTAVTGLKAQLNQFQKEYEKPLKAEVDKLTALNKEIIALQSQVDAQINSWKKEADTALENEKKKAVDAVKKQLPSALKKLF